MKTIKKIIAMLTLVSLVSLTGCTQSPSVNTNETSDTASNTILTSFYPIYEFTSAVTEGTDITVTNLTGPQVGCLHDYQLTTEDMRLITTSSTFVINGAGMETSFIEKAISQNKNMAIVDSSIGATILEEGHAHEEDHSHEESEVHDHEEEHHHENSHIWLSVSNAIIQVNNIAAQLAALYPAHESKFMENAASYTEKLTAIQPEKKDYDINVISFHNAFEYLADEMGFNVVESIEVEENATPSANLMASLITMCNAGEIDYILCADNDPGQQYAHQLAQETEVPILILNPFIYKDISLEGYIKVQSDNIQHLKDVFENE